MDESPQPSEEPYEVGDRVRVRLSVEDVDSPFEGTVCRVVHVFTRHSGDAPEPDTEIRIETDRASYRLETAESGETLPVVLRHRDLVPVTDAD